jgi:hypothetical protein
LVNKLATRYLNPIDIGQRVCTQPDALASIKTQSRQGSAHGGSRLRSRFALHIGEPRQPGMLQFFEKRCFIRYARAAFGHALGRDFRLRLSQPANDLGTITRMETSQQHRRFLPAAALPPTLGGPQLLSRRPLHRILEGFRREVFLQQLMPESQFVATFQQGGV